MSPRYAPLVLGTSACVYAVVAIATLLASTVSSEEFPPMLLSQRGLPYVLGACVLVACLLWVAWKSASVIRYAVRDHDVIVRNGIFWRKETLQPIVRIQHVEQFQGPLDKRFGLYTLKLFSAGTGHVTFQIPGLDARTAARLKRYLLEKTKASADSAAGAS